MKPKGIILGFDRTHVSHIAGFQIKQMFVAELYTADAPTVFHMMIIDCSFKLYDDICLIDNSKV
jgi:hypothetical protein